MYNSIHSVLQQVLTYVYSPAGYVGYDDAGQLTEAVRRKPYAVLLFDEFEKAHRDISALLLQVLDEGFLTDSQGHKIDFRNTLIVFTSNLGADILVGNDPMHPYHEEPNGDIAPSVRDGVMNVVQNSCRFSAQIPSKYWWLMTSDTPEFLNRIDEFIIFKRLSSDALRDIVDIRIKELQKRLDDRRITLEVSDAVRQWLSDRGYDPKFGARPLNRLISKQIGNGLADKIIRGQVKTGDRVIVKIDKAGDGLEVGTEEWFEN
jgi:ATP-dependent Clp protease ATP-binding subunit ClpB